MWRLCTTHDAPKKERRLSFVDDWRCWWCRIWCKEMTLLGRGASTAAIKRSWEIVLRKVELLCQSKKRWSVLMFFFKEMGVTWFVISAGSKKIREMRLHYLWKMNNPFFFFLLLKMSEWNRGERVVVSWVFGSNFMCVWWVRERAWPWVSRGLVIVMRMGVCGWFFTPTNSPLKFLPLLCVYSPFVCV